MSPTPTEWAAMLGVTPEEWPEFFTFACPKCGSTGYEPSPSEECKYICTNCWHSSWEFDAVNSICTLPDPLGPDPRACVWDGWLMRALMPSTGIFETPIGTFGVNTVNGGDYYGPTPTAALATAVLEARK